MAKVKAKAEQHRLLVLLGVFAVLAVIAAVRILGGGGLSGGSSVTDRVEYEAHQLPQLAMAELAPRPENAGDGGNNPFVFRVPPTPTARPTTPTRPRTPPPTRPPRPTRTPTPKNWKGPPPRFDREYIGHFGPLQLQVAAFRKQGGDEGVTEVEVAKVGDVLGDVFVIREIGLESVVVGYVGWPEKESTRVPLSEN